MHNNKNTKIVCGIAGIFRFDNKEIDETSLKSAMRCMNQRGPDASGLYIQNKIGLCHTRLSVIDLDSASNQPFKDATNRYSLIFNGEIFNYLDLKKQLTQKGIEFCTQSDTEVLLHLLISEGVSCLDKLNGFFAFAFYDNQSEKLIIARDKYGVKPLYLYRNKDYVAFASELKSLINLGIEKQIDFSSMHLYFQLNYIPAPDSILQHVTKLKQAHCLVIDNKGQETDLCYYEIRISESQMTYVKKKETLEATLSEAVRVRLVSDVPVGVFLSGGVDSSIIAMLAKRHKPDIQSYSVGFKGNNSFDESIYAEKVAKYLRMSHQTFHLTDQVMLDSINKMLEYSDEPFADSSAIALYNLCYHAKKHVTVALTGDGADEVFGGYNKHLAEMKIRNSFWLNSLLGTTSPLFKYLPESRGANFGNALRKIKKYASSVNLTTGERYWNWCCFTSELEALKLYSQNTLGNIQFEKLSGLQKSKTEQIKNKNLNFLLASDIDMVLEGDMLVKTDRMSMANSMELRNPFLDSKVIDFAFTLKEQDKINYSTSKKIVKDSFRPYLPAEVFERQKRGFEVPITQWLKKDLSYLIEKYLNNDFITEQHIFNPIQVQKIIQKLYSENPGEIAFTIWALINFQVFYQNYF